MSIEGGGVDVVTGSGAALDEFLSGYRVYGELGFDPDNREIIVIEVAEPSDLSDVPSLWSGSICLDLSNLNLDHQFEMLYQSLFSNGAVTRSTFKHHIISGEFQQNEYVYYFHHINAPKIIAAITEGVLNYDPGCTLVPIEGWLVQIPIDHVLSYDMGGCPEAPL